MCFKFKKDKPEIDLLHVSSDKVKQELDNFDMKLLYPVLLDGGQEYYYTSAVDWRELMEFIYFKYDMPKYIASRFDCDDFAVWMKGLVGQVSGLNYFGVVIGSAPSGKHAWNILRTEEGLLQFEPQTGQFIRMGERGYIPERVLI